MSQWHQRIRQLSREDRARYEDLADKFEAAWAGPTAPAIETYLDASNLRLLLLIHFIKCDLEFRHGLGQFRCVEDYVKRFPELAGESDALLELVLCEYSLDRPNRPSIDDLIGRFPRLAHQLRPALTALAPSKEWIAPSEYEDLQVVGKGNWGMVYRAHNRQMQRHEAIKVVLPEKITDERIQRLRQEIPIAARLNHPNIVQAYHSGESNGIPYFSMEYCPGGSLEERLKKQEAYTPTAAAELIKTLAAAVHQMHVFHVHRDLKPSNILFGAGDVPKIADFGLAINPKEASPNEIAGTPPYMAPEQVSPGRDRLGAPTDVWALGVILWELLSKRTPFAAKTVAEVFTKILELPPGALPDAPADLEAICHKCLQKRPSQRYQTAQALADDLETFLTGGLVKARSHPVHRKVTHWFRRNPIKSLMAAAMIALAIGYGFLQGHLRDLDVARANERSAQAEKLAESERLREHDTLVAAARQASRRAAWRDALQLFTRAINNRRPDQSRLRIERLVCYFATNKTQDLEAELTSLESLDLGDLEPQVKLLRGAWVLCDLGQQAKGRKIVAEALRKRHLLFTDADRYLADGLAAQRFGEASKSFEKAAQEDPFHHLAGVCHAVSLAAAGESKRAAARTRMMRAITPKASAPDLVDAIVAFSGTDRREMNARLDAYRQLLDESQRPSADRLRAFLTNLVDLIELLDRLAAGDAGDLSKLGPALRGLKFPNEPLALPVPAIGICTQRWLDVADCYGDWGSAASLGRPLQSFDRIEAVNGDHADAGLLLLLGVRDYVQAIGPVNAGDVPQAIKILTAAAQKGERVVDAPSIVRSSPTSYLGRALAFLADILISLLDAEPNSDRLERMRGHVHSLVVEGRAWKKRRAEFMDLAVTSATVPMTKQQAAAWELHTEAGKKKFATRRVELASLVELLLDDWALDEPANPQIAMLRGKLAVLRKLPLEVD